MNTDQLRKKYLDFFARKDHVLFRSDTLVPDDSTVLFTSAGMNQFKPYFLGEKKDIKRATSCQKCLRTDDLEEVGRTPFHHTFFEMLGNFSFGDYFKKETIEWAWEFLLKELNMKEKDLWVSVYKDDDEAYKIWKDHIGVSAEKIVKLGEKENFWPSSAPSLGPNGLCGPCSEIFFDRGKDAGCGKKNCDPGCDCDRFSEVWNLVFTQFNRVAENKLEPLPQKNIDTGMGLERMAAVLQGKYSNFEIDILALAAKEVRKLLDVSATDPKTTGLIHAIVDHARAATFSIADGVYPSNEERGYVIRKIIRKAVWGAHLVGMKKPFLYELPYIYAESMKGPYPEIREKEGVISKVIHAEEEKFLSTLKDGENQFSIIVEGLKKEKKDTVPAPDLFRIYDTYGFPLELSKEIAKDHNLAVDESGFEALLGQQQERSRKKSMFGEDIFKIEELKLKEVTEFVGYESRACEGQIVKIIKEGKEADFVSEGQEALLVLDATPFYAESGGQLADHGLITTNEGEFVVEDVSKIGETIVHKGRVQKGKISKDKAQPVVDQERRNALMRAHTATHLLQAVLRKVLGEHVTQQGSLVDEDRLRFDFTHFKALTSQELAQIESLVNNYIMKGIGVAKDVISYDEAKKQGALAFFKDKYQDEVRVVSIGDASKELCGGTHLKNTAEVGLFSIKSESSISSGVRRIEAVVGKSAQEEFLQLKKEIKGTASNLKCSVEAVSSAIKKMQDDFKSEKESREELEKELITLKSKEIISSKKEIQGISFLIHEFKDKEIGTLLCLSDTLRGQVGSLFLFVVSWSSEKNSFLCSTTDDLVKKGINAKKFVAQFKDDLGLRGGGRDNLVQGVIAQEKEGFLKKLEDSIKSFLSKK